ncbi:MAG TPA: GNAT family N-acetyltransferase [Novosphingobium sp.]|nr:GNAT family N-acetyltransferase [Novosphingobium sp.]
MTVLLRPPAIADVPALAALGRDSFVAKFASLYRPEDLACFLEETHSEAAVAAQLADPDRLYCLAERDGRLAGYCKLALVPDFPEHARGKRPIELKQLYTAPDATGGGIGGALMEWALDAARSHGADEIQLSVWSRNHAAQRFYARHGFAKVADVFFRVGEQLDEEFLFSVLL